MNRFALFFAIMFMVLCPPSGRASQIPPDWARANAKIQLWLGELDAQFCRQPKYQRVSKLLMKILQEEDEVVCKFYVTSDGSIDKLRVIKSSGSNKADRAILRLMNAATPLTKPPCRLARMQSVIVEFRKHERLVESSRSDRLTNARIGEQNADDLLSE